MIEFPRPRKRIEQQSKTYINLDNTGFQSVKGSQGKVDGVTPTLTSRSLLVCLRKSNSAFQRLLQWSIIEWCKHKSLLTSNIQICTNTIHTNISYIYACTHTSKHANSYRMLLVFFCSAFFRSLLSIALYNSQLTPIEAKGGLASAPSSPAPSELPNSECGGVKTSSTGVWESRNTEVGGVTWEDGMAAMKGLKWFGCGQSSEARLPAWRELLLDESLW